MDASRVPKLQFLHSQGALNAGKLEVLRRLPTDELKRTLRSGQPGSLKTRPDGTVLDGHHRLSILLEPGEDIDELQREIMEKES
jgi:hypothetical protein